MSDETLVMLVGGNPLPNYIVAMHFKPAKIILVHTTETKKVAENLERVLRDGDGLGKQSKVELLELENPKDPSAIREKAKETFKEILEGNNVRLDYTGGTKLMATQFRLALQEVEKEPYKISTYLDGYANKILYDTKCEESIDAKKIGLDIKKLSKIHGLEEIGETKDLDIRAILNNEKANYFAEKVISISNKSLSGYFYNAFRKENWENIIVDYKQINKKVDYKKILEKCVSDIQNNGEIPSDIQKFTRDTADQIKNIETLTKKRMEYTEDFFCGGWLELWCQSCISKIFEKDEFPPKIFVGKEYKLKGRQFEIDVCFVRKMRYFQVSCTIDSSLGLTKTKLFETYVRTRQVGGDLARTALVCFRNSTDIDELKKDAGLAWDDPSKPTVFGLDDLKAWVKGDLSSLEEWCNSD